MLFISIYTYEPDKRDVVLKRRFESLFTPEGVQCLGQWSCTTGGRVFTLFEGDDALILSQWAHAWSDLGKFDVFPVVDTEQLLEVMAQG